MMAMRCPLITCMCGTCHPKYLFCLGLQEIFLRYFHIESSANACARADSTGGPAVMGPAHFVLQWKEIKLHVSARLGLLSVMHLTVYFFDARTSQNHLPKLFTLGEALGQRGIPQYQGEKTLTTLKSAFLCSKCGENLTYTSRTSANSSSNSF